MTDTFSDGERELAQWLHDTHKNKSQNIGCYNFKLCKERDAWLLTARELLNRPCKECEYKEKRLSDLMVERDTLKGTINDKSHFLKDGEDK